MAAPITRSNAWIARYNARIRHGMRAELVARPASGHNATLDAAASDCAEKQPHSDPFAALGVTSASSVVLGLC